MYPASEWRIISLRALDDDPHVPVLLNPSVPKDAFECSGFPARRWTVVSSSSLQEPAQTWAQVLLGIFHHRGKVLAQVNGLCREGNATLQQEAADLIDQRG